MQRMRRLGRWHVPSRSRVLYESRHSSAIRPVAELARLIILVTNYDNFLLFIYLLIIQCIV